jgi:hypothetical protein
MNRNPNILFSTVEHPANQDLIFYIWTMPTGNDIFIIAELERPIVWKFFTLEMFLENTFDRKIDLVTKNALKAQIKERILDQVKYA